MIRLSSRCSSRELGYLGHLSNGGIDVPVADQSNSTTRRHGVPERRNQWLLILGIVVALLVAAVALSKLRRDGSTDLLRADPGALDFGVVWSDESFSWTVPLQNESGRELTIRDVNSSCGC